MKKTLLLLLLVLTTSMNAQIVISQVYGGGGNSGAPFTNDFIELFNRGTVSQDLSTWSVQYTSATGSSTWSITNLVGIIQPGQYYLIQQAAGGTPSGSLPTPDVTGTINMSGTTGKVILVNNQTAESGSNPSGTNIVDKIGYGPTATGFEGTPTAVLSNTTAALRNGNGSIDTDNNLNDFTIGTPTPRNSTTVLSLSQNIIKNITVYPNPASNIININDDSVKTIYDVLGKQLLQTSKEVIDVSILTPGIYTIKIGNKGTKKLIIK